ncbi:MAG: 16S rRNA (guanine(527)-N(7))-methyltransferase RsmG [Prevotella sp.]|nr:16S rRNA (guanine(527)-N(7))-methyltransferase RsmG [Prevotella sp.]
MERILRLFPNLDDVQKRQLSMLQGLYEEWNAKINVVSRKDISNLYVHHVLHSLAIARAFRFVPGTTILDVGTGGGFPGIPLAIAFPHCLFTLIDSTGKKIRVVEEVVRATGLANVTAVQRRCEEETGVYDFAVSRAVMPLADLYKLVRKNISAKNRNAQSGGIITLKGGDITNEIKPFRHIAEVTEISSLFPAEEWFKEKYIIYLRL